MTPNSEKSQYQVAAGSSATTIIERTRARATGADGSSTATACYVLPQPSPLISIVVRAEGKGGPPLADRVRDAIRHLPVHGLRCDEVTLNVVATGTETPFIVRLRKGLKWLLRANALRCVRVADIPPTETPTPDIRQKRV